MQGYVLITVKHAANLKDTELLGKQEPYIRLELDGAKTETSTDKGVSPVFNEQVKLPLPASHSAHSQSTKRLLSKTNTYPPLSAGQLLVSCFNEKTLLPDRLIGKGTISLSSAHSGGSQTVALYDKRGNPAGHVVLELDVYDGQRSQATHHATHDKTEVDTTTAALASTHIAPNTQTTHAVHGADTIPFRPTGGHVISAEHHSTVTDHPVVKEVHDRYAVHTPVLHEAVAETRHTRDVQLAPTTEVIAERDEIVNERVSPAAAVPAPRQFAVVQDHSVVKQQVATVRETTPVEKLYQVETREAGTRHLPGSTEVVGEREDTLDEHHTGAPVLPKPQAFSAVECNEVVKERHDRYVETTGVAKTYAEETKRAGERVLPGTAEILDERIVLREA